MNVVLELRMYKTSLTRVQHSFNLFKIYLFKYIFQLSSTHLQEQYKHLVVRFGSRAIFENCTDICIYLFIPWYALTK